MLVQQTYITFKSTEYPMPFNFIHPHLTRGKQLTIPSNKPQVNAGENSFTNAAPLEWGRLPQTSRDQQTIVGLNETQRHIFLDKHFFSHSHPLVKVPFSDIEYDLGNGLCLFRHQDLTGWLHQFSPYKMLQFIIIIIST